MMDQPFFPLLSFAIAYAGLLGAGLAYAAWKDWKTLIVSRWISVALLGTGLVANVIRCGWISAEGHPAWVIAPGNALLGGIDGVLFTLAGFVVGFGLFFVFWIFGVCGGGDVKLVGATGAWLGPQLILYGIMFSAVFLVVLVLVKLGYRILGGALPSPATTTPAGKGNTPRPVTSYALSFALGVGLVLLWRVGDYMQYLQRNQPGAG